MHEAAVLETPSGKAATEENFPVTGLLLPARLRPHIEAFYAYARTIDDIADNPYLRPSDKLRRLNQFAWAASGVDTANPALRRAHDVRHSLAATAVTRRHCIDLTKAFKLDQVKSRYRDWNDLMGYCNLSAAPVGRYLIDLHGESDATYPHSDALCNALQVLNHLQDCREDYKSLDRVYLPQNWMTEAGIGVEELNRVQSSTALRQVFDRCLDATDGLMDLARGLPDKFKNHRFAMDAAIIVNIAGTLSSELRRRDPLAERVALTRLQYSVCCARGIGRVLFSRLRRLASGGDRARAG
ncbi:MAG: squalene synthase HpnC [Gammaproteobacteria bacterium]|nr:squalene synthase HpnC [Gammaproteobacteria bacterium]